MLPFSGFVLRKTLLQRVRCSLVVATAAGLLLHAGPRLTAQEMEAKSVAQTRLISPIDEHVLVAMPGSVRPDIASAEDLGAVEDGKQLHLYLLLQRTTAQQADLDNLIARQQEPTAAEYHKWLTPKEFGARFGASPDDIAKLSAWLESHGLQVRSVLNNASMIDFAATAGQVREAFHTQLHYFNIRGGKYLANVNEPQIPAALTPVVAGIKGLARVPPLPAHTKVSQGAYDKETHSWKIVNPTAADTALPAFNAGSGYFLVTPQDLYTIYNVNPQFTAGNLAASATVAVIEQSDMEFGTVNATTGAATGGDVATFRSIFGVPGTLNMHVYHGYGTVTCKAPGLDPENQQEDEEASLDAEWINATAPSANLIFMSCDQAPDQGVDTSMMALIDNNLSDVMSLSYGESELAMFDYSFQDTLYAQAATQGQSIFVSSGDSGSDVFDGDQNGAAKNGINVNGLGSPLVTVAGGTDFSDQYDAQMGGPPVSTYWSSTNTSHYGDALGYVPETAWNPTCASSINAEVSGFTGAGYCGSLPADETGGSVVGGSGGISTHYSVPAWQTGTSGYSNSMYAQPDIAGFASYFAWNHSLIFCDSNPAYDGEDIGCASPAEDNFGDAGGTSFVAPYLAGAAGLLRSATGARQGLLNPALYALAKAQYNAAATKTACYSNGQTSNTGVTTGLPAAACIFNDVTTNNNDVACLAGSKDCFVNTGDAVGILSLNGAKSLAVAYPSTVGFDQVTGLGTVNVNNLITKWNTAFGSTTALSASFISLSASQSTSLTATVTGKTPTGYVDTPPALTGTASFKAGTTALGNCTLSSGTCKLTVAGSSLKSGANSVTATFSGSGTYPASTSSIVTVTVTGGSSSAAVLTSPTPGSTLAGGPVTFTWSPGTSATGYALWIGSTGAGSDNLYYSGERASTVTSLAASGLPVNGETIYVRLVTYYASSSTFASYTYTSATGGILKTPAPGSTLAGAGVTFSWTAGAGATGYALWIGSTGVGSDNLYYSGEKASTVTSLAVSGLPVNGETIYVRLITYYGSSNSLINYTYTSATGAVLKTPTPGSTLAGSSATFTWTAGAGATGYALWIGNSATNADNLYYSGEKASTVTSLTVSGLPTNGETLYVRLITYYGSSNAYINYTYKAAAGAVLTTPTPGSTLAGSSVTFSWTAGVNATGYALWIGSSATDADNLFYSGEKASTVTSLTVSGLPTNGETLYVRLITYYGSSNAYINYTYTAK